MDVSTKLPAALCVAHLTKTYQRGEHRVHALADVSLSVEQGDFFGLLGPNGAGKSTLISALGALIKPDGGSVEILGRNIRDDYRFCKMAIGIVPQEITVDPFFTVKEILQQQSGYYGLRDNGKWIDTLIDRLGLTEKTNARVSRLSGGMKRRVLIAQALVHRPPVIVLDEPTAGLDPKERVRFRNLIASFAQDKIVILSTHIVSDVEYIADEILVMRAGAFVMQGAPDAITAQVDRKSVV